MRKSDLHDYQRLCVQHILEHRHCGIFLDMGLGKTVTTLTAIESLMFDYCEINSVLIIAPKRVAETVWQEEAANWDHLRHLRFSKIVGTQKQREAALRQPADIYIISRDNIAWLCSLCGGGRLPFDMVVVDELSSFKSYKSVRFKALRQVQPYFKRFVGLTGTPAPNGLIDLWPQIYLMDRGERLERTISKYREKYFSPGRTNGHVVFSYNLLGGSEALIHERISDICISMKAEDYLTMPLRTDNFIKLRMPKEIADMYKAFERDKVLELLNRTETVVEVDEDGHERIVERPVALSIANAAALSNKLLQFANGSVYRSASETIGDIPSENPKEREVLLVHDLKINALKDILEDSNGQPVLVAWTFQFDRDRILKELSKYKPRELKTAQDIADWNAGKVQLMLAHPASAGHGLNLQAGGNVIVWYGQTWSLELYQQFNARLYRQGQKNGVIINHLVVEGTHDEDVIAALKSKNRRQNALLTSITAKIDRYKQLNYI